MRLCFGSRKLFRAQFALTQNGYASHAEWKADWQARRDAQFFVLGSKDETAGNQSCQASVEDDGTLTLKLRLPDALAAEGRYITIPGVRFAYGHEDIVAALLSSQRVQFQTKDGKPAYRRTGTAISYRFLSRRQGLAGVRQHGRPRTGTNDAPPVRGDRRGHQYGPSGDVGDRLLGQPGPYAAD